MGQLELARGNIAVDEYARLMIAVDNGTAQDILADLDLPRAALMRVQRVWLDRLSQSADVAERLRQAIERISAAS